MRTIKLNELTPTLLNDNVRGSYGEKLAPFVLKNAGLIGLISECYSLHGKLAIAPQDVWNQLVAEVRTLVANNPSVFAPLFTDTPGNKQVILLPADAGDVLDIRAFSSELSQRIKFDSKVLFPEFSEPDNNAIEYNIALFMDMASSFYEYSTFCCGIPEIKILGTHEDWNTLIDHWQVLSGIIAQYINLGEYTTRVANVLLTFRYADKVENWENIFTQSRYGSGGDLKIDGWITNLFYVQHPSKLIKNFVNTEAQVFHKNVSTKKKFETRFGAYRFAVCDEGFHRLAYSSKMREVPYD